MFKNTDTYLCKMFSNTLDQLGRSQQTFTMAESTRCQWCSSDVFIVDFEDISYLFVAFLLMLWTAKILLRTFSKGNRTIPIWKVARRIVATQYNCPPDNPHLVQLAPGQFPPRTIGTGTIAPQTITPGQLPPYNYHLGKLPPDNCTRTISS